MKISGPTDGEVGQTLVYSVTITNAGPSASDDVVVRINVPKSFSAPEVRLSQGACVGSEDAHTFSFECGVGQLTPGESDTGSVTVRLEARETTFVSISASSTTPDPASGNNLTRIVFLPPPPPSGKPIPKPPPNYPVAQPQLPPAMVGRPYSARITVIGGVPPYRIVLRRACAGPDPEGLTVSEEGLMSFTPVAAGAWGFCLAIYDSADPGRQWASSVSLRILEALVVQKLPNGITGSAYDSRFVSGGQPPYRVTFQHGQLPPGLRPADGFARVAGKPGLSGPFQFTVSVEDNLGFVTQGSQAVEVRVARGRHLRANEALTPGRAAGRPQCVLPTNGVRRVARPSPAVRSRLLAAYGVWWRPSLYVIDQLIPVELGGHPTHLSNLWPQLAERAKRTDALEQFLLRRVCSGEMSLRAAQQRIKTHKINVG